MTAPSTCALCRQPAAPGRPGDTYECLGERGNALLLWICDACVAIHSPAQGEPVADDNSGEPG